jgi:hypothetical protein
LFWLLLVQVERVGTKYIKDIKVAEHEQVLLRDADYTCCGICDALG